MPEHPIDPLNDSPCDVCGDTPVVVGINGQWYCINHVDAGMGDAFTPLHAMREAMRDAE